MPPLSFRFPATRSPEFSSEIRNCSGLLEPEAQIGMTTFVLRRLLGLIPVLLGISVVVFFLMQLIPGDVAQAMLGLTARPQDVANLREALGLNEPIYVQYVKWLERVLRGDLGISLQQRTEVLPFLLGRFKNTLLLTTAATVISLIIGLPAGIFFATKLRCVSILSPAPVLERAVRRRFASTGGSFRRGCSPFRISRSFS